MKNEKMVQIDGLDLDTIHNSGYEGIVYDPETGIHWMPEDDYGWWREYFSAMQKISDRYAEICERYTAAHGDTYATQSVLGGLDYDLQSADGDDYDGAPARMGEVLDRFEADLEPRLP